VQNATSCATGGLLLGDFGGDVRPLHGHIPRRPRASAQIGGQASTDDERRLGGAAISAERRWQHGSAHGENAPVDGDRWQQQSTPGVRRFHKSAKTFE